MPGVAQQRDRPARAAALLLSGDPAPMHLRTLLQPLMFAFGLLAFSGDGMAIEEAPYRTTERDGRFELRDYDAYVVAETLVEGDFDSVGNEGFRRLFRYIDGGNRGARSISMTAPVQQVPASREIAMTAPVEQSRVGSGWRVAFVLPAGITLAAAPVPDDPRITLAQVPARRMACLRYSGTWSQANYAEHLGELRRWIAARGLVALGEPVWARYNPPIMPWFLRRNEILIEVRPE
jgi:hypothetical protein